MYAHFFQAPPDPMSFSFWNSVTRQLNLSNSSSSAGKAAYEPVSSEEALLGDSKIDISERVILKRPSRNWTAVHITLVSIYTLIFGLSFLHLHQSYAHGTNLIFSPARQALNPVTVVNDETLTKWNKFRGEPRPELDKAWEDLLKNINIRLSAETLRKIDRKSTRLSDGSNTYLGQLTVYHQLHCLKSLRQAFHPDYYHVDMRHMADHIDHCLDNLRRLAMCKADISILTFDWVDNNRKPLPNFQIEQECYNWDTLDEWAAQHTFDVFDNKTLLHPEFGPSFPVDMQGNLIETDDPDPLEGIIITPPTDYHR